jgi:eukaryotic-like serine/threonine-protein kinase
MRRLIGAVIDNFEIKEKLGGGGMGIVYRARHPILSLDVAIKVMRPELTEQEGFYARFEREAQTIARLQHPGIVGVTNFGQYEGIPYLMMDFVEGPTLRSLLQDSPFGLPPETGITLVQRIAEALAYAHSKGVLHLDLKPDNILLDPDRSPASAVNRFCPYRPVISDFGLARLRVAPGMAVHTSQVIGTPHYMSPEQCLGKPMNEQSDLYSLGIMFYETLTGKRPFPIVTIVQAIHYHCNELPEPPSSHVSHLAPAMDAFVLKMLAKDPAQRPASAEEVADRLADALAASTPIPGVQAPGVHKVSVGTPAGTEKWSARPAIAYIDVEHSGKRIDRFPMTSESILVGRLPICDLHLETGDKLISKRHCEIRWQGGEMLVRDLHSTNKTYMNDVALDPDIPFSWPSGVPVRLGVFVLTWTPIESDDQTALEMEAVKVPLSVPRIECEAGEPAVLRLRRQPMTIGRLPGSEMMIADPAVSKRHCVIHWNGKVVTVEDLKSTNGTYLGDARLEANQAAAWPAGAELRIGPHVVRLIDFPGK